jgi:hypothetical protein
MLVMGVTAVAAAVALAMLSRSHAWVLYLTALTACGFTLGLVYAFTTVANQAVVSPQRAGFSKGGAIDVIRLPRRGSAPCRCGGAVHRQTAQG